MADKLPPDPVEKPSQPEPKIEPPKQAETRPSQQRHMLTGASFAFTPDTIEAIEAGGKMTKFRQNVAASEVMREVLQAGRKPTQAEQEVMALYAGFGGIKEIFNPYAQDVEYKDREKWLKAAEDLRRLIGDEAFEAANRSTQNAHYTSPRIVQAMWRMAERMGFAGGRVLEPSMGSGNFLGLTPAHLREKTAFTGVELDLTTGEIARLLYPDANIKIQGFEDTQVPDNFYDLAIGNVPFGAYRVSDPRYNKCHASVHNYFFLKAVDKVRPGGLVMFITSTGTLDAPGAQNVRNALYEKADLVGAMRFPAETFKNALTSVVTDLVILRKRLPGEKQRSDLWTQTEEVPDPAGGKPIRLNSYLAAFPEKMLGDFNGNNRMYSGRANVDRTDDFEQRLERAIGGLRENVMTDRAMALQAEMKEAGKAMKRGAYVVEAGELFRNEDGQLVKVEADARRIQRVEGMLQIRDVLNGLTDAEMGRTQDSADDLRKQLNAAYDLFTARYGAISDKANRNALEDDPELPRLMSLEDYDSKKKRATKRQIFFKATIAPARRDAKPENITEAVVKSLSLRGEIVLPMIAQDLDISQADAAAELIGKELAFQTPAGNWEIAAQYLSGNIRRKLGEARAAAENDPFFEANVKALEAVMPPDIPHTAISVQMGAPWIEPSDISQFVAEMFNDSASSIKVFYDRPTGAYQVEMESSARARDSQETTTTWGTPEKPFRELLDLALQGRAAKVTKEVPAPTGGNPNATRTVIDPEKTQAANTKLDAIKQRFREWLWEDDGRRERLTRRYNEMFNSLRAAEYDSSFMGDQVPGMSPDWKLRPHQMAAVLRGITDRRGLMAHEVGLGKAQPLTAKVLTPTGWKQMGEIRVGDQVIAGDGTATVVTGVFPQGKKEIFRVVFNDGSATECCDEHLWFTQTYQERLNSARGYDFPGKVRSLSEIRQTLTARPNSIRAKNHSIPIVGSVRFQPVAVPVDPYLLGVLIGDGSLSGVTVAFTTKDAELVELCRQALLPGLEIRQKASADIEYSICRQYKTGKQNALMDALRLLGLWGKRSETKFVPDCYKFNSSEVRLTVLRGLLDTDGYVLADGSHTSFTTVSRQLAEDVVFLVQSLGGISSIREKTPTYTHNGERRQGQLAYTVRVNLPPHVVPFRLGRKLARFKPKTKYVPIRYIAAIEPVGVKEAQCIAIEHPSHLYVTDDCIVTHNTLAMIATASELKRLGIAAKPAIAVPKKVLPGFAQTVRDAFPLMKLHVIDSRDAEKRQRTMSEIATGDFDLVLMTHDNLNMLRMRPEFEAGILRKELDEVNAVYDMLRDARREAGGGGTKADSRILATVKKRRENLAAKIKDALNAELKDDAITFEDTGIDFMFVDEFHEYKTLHLVTALGQIKGVPTGDSQRAINMLMRARYLQGLQKGGGLIAATGTPVSNSLVEAYIMAKFLQPEVLENAGVDAFDAWARNFAEVVSALEFDATGRWKPTSRLSKFKNLPELQTMSRVTLDVKTAKETGILQKRPQRKDMVITIPLDDTQKLFMRYLRERADRLKSGKVDPSVDNYLVASTDGRFMSADIRLVLPGMENRPSAKIQALVENVTRIHQFDTTWKPAMIEQSEARGWRQGNENAEIEILTYVVKGSFDTTMWATVARKQQAISSFMRGAVTAREMTEEDGEVLSYEQIAAAASGDQDYLRKAELEQRVFKLAMMKQAHDADITNRRQAIPRIERGIAAKQRAAERYDDLAEWAKGVRERAVEYVSSEGKPYTDRAEAAKALTLDIAAAQKRNKDAKIADQDRIYIGEYKGVRVRVEAYGDVRGVIPAHGRNYESDVFHINPNFENYAGTLQSFDQSLASVAANTEAKRLREAEIPSLEQDLANLRRMEETPFPHEEELTTAKAQLDRVSKRLAAKEKEIENAGEPLVAESGLDVRMTGQLGRRLRRGLREKELKPSDIPALLERELAWIKTETGIAKAEWAEYVRKKTEDQINRYGLEDVAMWEMAKSASRAQRAYGDLYAEQQAQAEGGVLKERSNDWQPKPVSQSSSFADIADNIRFRTSKSPARAKIIYGNEQAHFWINRADRRLYSDPAGFNGLSLSPDEARQRAAEIRSEKGLWEKDKGRLLARLRPSERALYRRADAQIDALAKTFEDLADKYDRVIYIRGNRTFRGMRSTIYHELTHDAERRFHGSMANWFRRAPHATRIAAELDRLGYRENDYVSETIAHLLGGQRWKVKLSLEEAVEFLDDYFANVSFRRGREAIITFQELHTAPEMRQTLREAKEKYGPRTGIQGGSGGLPPGLPGDEGTGGERSLRDTEPGEASLAGWREERPGGVSPGTERQSADRRRDAEGLTGEVPLTFYSQVVERTIEQRLPFIEEALAAGASVNHISIQHHGSDWAVVSFENAKGTYLLKGDDVYVTQASVQEAQSSIEADPVALPGIRDLRLAGDIEIKVSESRGKENHVEPRGRGLDYSL